jgi:DNA-binding transcriptional ArsR family regulator
VSRTGDTKKRIIGLLEQKNGTLTDLSNKLELAPSTVSQHLQEMTEAGIIKQVDDRPRKWKYYEINRGYNSQSRNDRYQNRVFDVKRVAIPIAVIALAAVFVFALYTKSSSGAYASAQQVYIAPGSAVPSGSTVFSVSDAPPIYNISSLNVTIDNASIHSESTGKWYRIPLQAATFDLIQLRNISSILSGVKLDSGMYNDLVLYVSNVSAVVNGTRQNVILPSGKLIVAADFNITSNTTNWINLDFDLGHSLHITPGGKLVMMPVIDIRHADNNSLELNQSSIIISRTPGRIREALEFGMDQNGSMIRNFSTAQNISIYPGLGGRFNEVENGSVPIPIIIRGRHSLIMGGDARALINSSLVNSSGADLTANWSIIPVSWRGRCMSIGGNCCLMEQQGINATNSSNTSGMMRCCIFRGGPTPESGDAYVRRCLYSLDGNGLLQANLTASGSVGELNSAAAVPGLPQYRINNTFDIFWQNNSVGSNQTGCTLQNGEGTAVAGGEGSGGYQVNGYRTNSSINGALNSSEVGVNASGVLKSVPDSGPCIGTSKILC